MIEKDTNVKIVVGHLQHDFLQPLRILLSCEECNKQSDTDCLNNNHRVIFKPSDIIRILCESKKKYLGDGDLGNIHLFLDEVSHLGQDWASLDRLAENPTNSMWLGLNPEFYHENMKRINLQNFKRISLDFVLRNTKQINNLANDIRRYTLSYSKVAMQVNVEKTIKPLFEYKRNYDDEQHHISESGHVVDGLPPRLIILEQCRCVFTSTNEFSQCLCLPERCEAALRHCIAYMFDLNSELALPEMVKMLDETLHISLMYDAFPGTIGSIFKSVLKILENYKLAYALPDNAIEFMGYSSKSKFQYRHSKSPSHCRIWIVINNSVLGKEFTNLIYFDNENNYSFINPYTKDLRDLYILNNVSRAKCKLAIITVTGKEYDRGRVDQLRKTNISNHSPNQYEPRRHWFFYSREIIYKFMLVDTIKKGSLLLLPLPSQKCFNKRDAIRLLQKGAQLDEKLRQIKEQGNTIIQKREGTEKYQLALRIFVKGLVICQRRLTGDYPFSIFDPLNHLGDHEEANNYLNAIKEEELKLLLNCGVCLIYTNLTKEAYLLFQFLVKNNPKNDNAVFYKAKCLYEMGDYNLCIECLNECLQLNESKESATKLLGRAQRKLKDHGSTNYPDDLTELEINIKRRLKRHVNKNTNLCLLGDIIWDCDSNSVISLNVKMLIINKYLKPISGFNEECLESFTWNMKLGFEYDDLYKS